MEKIKSESQQLQKICLPNVENAIKEYIDAYTKAKSLQTANFHKEAEKLNERIERTKMAIECDEAAISFIKSQMKDIMKNKENLQCPKQILHKKMEKYRNYGLKLSENLRMYEKRLGLSMKKLNDDTLWVAFHFLNPENIGEFSLTLRIENKIYCVVKCTPFIEELENLVQNLNTSNDFSGFLKSLRQAFKRVA
jgi:hypothetical protein